MDFPTVFWPIIAVVAVAITPMVAYVALAGGGRFISSFLWAATGVGFGSMIGQVAFHLLPGSVEERGALSAFGLVAAGIFIVWILEKAMHGRHDKHGHHVHEHATRRTALLIDAGHNFLDGLIIAAGFYHSPELGMMAAFGIVLHELPKNLGDTATYMGLGFSLKEAVKRNAIVAATSFLGLLAHLLFKESLPNFTWLEPFLAGGLLYLAFFHLLPRLIRAQASLPGKAVAVTAGLLLLFGAVRLSAPYHEHAHGHEEGHSHSHQDHGHH